MSSSGPKKLQLTKTLYREAQRPDGTLGFAPRGRGRGKILGPGWDFEKVDINKMFEQVSVKEENPSIKPQFTQPAATTVRQFQNDDTDSDEEIVIGTSRGVSSASMTKVFASPSMKLRSFEEQDTQDESLKTKQKALDTSKVQSFPVTLSTNQSNQKTNVPVSVWKTTEVSKQPLFFPTPEDKTPEKKGKVAQTSSRALRPGGGQGNGGAKAGAGVSKEESTHFLSLLTRAKVDDNVSPPVVPVINNDGSLPVDAFRDRIVNTVKENTVTVIRGDTGCGKSSRVPQFLIDADASHKVVVAQPRRLSAIALARRVSAEREETCGNSVGFRVGQTSKCGPNTVLTFVTVGYLLERLVHHFAGKDRKGDMQQLSKQWEYNHIVVDEVHERDIETDFLCLVLRLLLQRHDEAVRKGETDTPPPFKVVCMSATFDPNEFVRYFRPVTLTSSVGLPLAVGCLRYPITEVYLDQLKQHQACFKQEANIDKLLASSIFTQVKKTGDGMDASSDVVLPESAYDIGAKIVLETARQKPGQGILVFVGGMADIDNFVEHLYHVASESNSYNSKQKRAGGELPYGIELLVLHSLIDLSHQAAALDACKANQSSKQPKVQVVVATNIAESSLTLPNLSTVVDFGVHKEVSYGEDGSALKRVWVSRASARQRAGRAGRLAPGTVYRIYPKQFFENIMEDWDAPEMTRMPLDRVVLRAKLLGVSSVHQCLMDSLVPPPRSAIDSAINELLSMGVLSLKHSSSSESKADSNDPSKSNIHKEEEIDDRLEVTPLGEVLASLPLDLALGRLLCMAAPLGMICEAVVLAIVIQGGTRGDIFVPLTLQQVNSGGGGGGGGGGSFDDGNEQLVWSMRVRQRWDRRFYSEPLAALDVVKQFLSFNLELERTQDKNNLSLNHKSNHESKEKKWCLDHGINRKKLQDLMLKVCELSVRVSSVFPGASSRLGLCFQQLSSVSGKLHRMSSEDLSDFDSKRALVCGLGMNIPMLRFLLASHALLHPAQSLVKGVPKLTPPKALSRFNHSIVAPQNSGRENNEEDAVPDLSTMKPPHAARVALLQGVSFKPNVFNSVAAASSAFRAKLEELIGPIKSIEFLSDESTSTLAFALSKGTWLIEFGDTLQIENRVQSNIAPNKTVAIDRAWTVPESGLMFAETMTHGFEGRGFSGMHKYDIPLGLKLLIALSKQKGGLKFTLQTQQKAAKNGSKDKKKSSKGSVNQNVSVVVSVSSVRWSFQSQWSLMMDGSSVQPSKQSLLASSCDCSKGGSKTEGFMVCSSLSGRRGGSSQSSSLIAEMTTLLPHDEFSLAAVMLISSPGNCFMGLGVDVEDCRFGSSPDKFQTGWISPAFAKEQVGNTSPNNSHEGVLISKTTQHRWGSCLSSSEIQLANIVRSMMSRSIMKQNRSRLGSQDTVLTRNLKNALRVISSKLTTSAVPSHPEVVVMGIEKQKQASKKGKTGTGAEVLFSTSPLSTLDLNADQVENQNHTYLPIWTAVTAPTLGPPGCSLASASSTNAYTYTSDHLLASSEDSVGGERDVSEMGPSVEEHILSASELEVSLKTQQKANTSATMFREDDSNQSTVPSVDILFADEERRDGVPDPGPPSATLAMLFGGGCGGGGGGGGGNQSTVPSADIPFANEERRDGAPDPSATLAMLFGGGGDGGGGDGGNQSTVPSVEIPFANEERRDDVPDPSATLAMLFGGGGGGGNQSTVPSADIPFANEERRDDVPDPGPPSATLAMLFGGGGNQSTVPSANIPFANEERRDGAPDPSATLAMLFGGGGNQSTVPSANIPFANEERRDGAPDPSATLAMLFGGGGGSDYNN